jgi:hypothetical protein
MIRKKNLSHEVFTLKTLGSVTAATNKDGFIVPFDGFISNLYGLCSTITGNTNSILDINKNGTTIFGAAVKCTFTTGSVTASFSALTSNPTSVSAGDLITLDADSVSTTLTNAFVDVCISKVQDALCGTLSDQNTLL